jgi:signal transduction histidine kinase
MRVFGEMVDVLWRAGNQRGAIQLEELWNQLGETMPLVLLCAYRRDDAGAGSRAAVDRAHSHVLTARATGPCAARPIDGDDLVEDEASAHARAMAEELSRRHGLEEALRAAREREGRAALDLENKLRELDGLAYMASHDLAAPLRAISNLAQWVVDDLGEAMTEESRRLMQLLQSRVTRMESLIEGLLAYTRAGRTPPPIERVDVAALLGEIVAALAPPEPAAVTFAPELPIMETERTMLRDVLHRLIGNAFKHAERPDVRVHVGVVAQDNLWHFSVRDNGPGIAAPFHERIFKPLTTLQSRDTRESTGIGLAIVDKLVRMRGGRVWVESSAGQGATFHFTWPPAPWARPLADPRGEADGRGVLA